MKEVDVSPDAQETALDLELDPGISVPLAVVDPDNKSLTNVEVTGRVFDSYIEQITTTTFNAEGFAPDEGRLMIFRLVSRNLGKVQVIHPADAKGPPIVVSLEQLATFNGRVLDPAGHPVSEMRVSPRAVTGAGSAYVMPTRTDEQGRFQCTVAPGSDYFLSFDKEARGFTSDVKKFPITSSANHDLGDIHVKLME